MVRRISAKDARAKFSELLGSVYYTKEPVIVEKKGKPYAVLISLEQYEGLQRERERAWTAVDDIRARNAEKDPEEVLRDVTEVVETVRQERYEQSRQGSQGRH